MSLVELPRPERTDAQYFDLDQTRGALASGLPVAWPPMEIVHTVIDGQVVIFACNMERDPIQAAHRKGAFYEAEDLARIRALLPSAPRILDVGANVAIHPAHGDITRSVYRAIEALCDGRHFKIARAVHVGIGTARDCADFQITRAVHAGFQRARDITGVEITRAMHASAEPTCDVLDDHVARAVDAEIRFTDIADVKIA